MPKQSTDRRAQEPARIYQLHVELEGITPTVWRRLLVPDWITLGKLHDLLQRTMGWTNSHLHEFQIGAAKYGIPDNEWPEMSPQDDRHITLAECLGNDVRSFRYEYDFGDGWDHLIRVERILPLDQVPHYPLCSAGANACPPEDVGGVGGYMNFLQEIRDPVHPEHAQSLAWCGGFFDPGGFDLNAVNAALRKVRIPSRR